MRADCIHREPQLPCDFRRGFPLQPHSVDSFYVLFFHLDNSPFEFAVLCVIALARCPPYSGRDVTGPWGLFPWKLMRICTRSPVPLSPGKRPEDVTGPTPLGQKGQNGQISLPAEWDWSDTPRRVVCRHPVPAPWVWVQCNRTRTDGSVQAGWILPS